MPVCQTLLTVSHHIAIWTNCKHNNINFKNTITVLTVTVITSQNELTTQSHQLSVLLTIAPFILGSCTCITQQYTALCMTNAVWLITMVSNRWSTVNSLRWELHKVQDISQWNHGSLFICLSLFFSSSPPSLQRTKMQTLNYTSQIALQCYKQNKTKQNLPGNCKNTRFTLSSLVFNQCASNFAETGDQSSSSA